MRSWKFDFGPAFSVAHGYIRVTANMAYQPERGYGFLGLGPDGYREDPRSDGFVMAEGQEIKLREVSKPDPKTVDDDAIAVTEPGMPIRFAVRVPPNTYYKVKVTLRGADQSWDASVFLFSEKRHFLLTAKRILPYTKWTHEFNVHVCNVYSKETGVYEDTMLNLAVCGENAALSSVEIQHVEHGKTLWVLGDSTVCDQLATLPYFNLHNYAGIGQALAKYVGPDLAVANYAESGLNTHTSKPHFDQFKERIRPGDFVYFEFGHNHKKDGPEGYYQGISQYYEHVHAKGACFIIVGPIDRHREEQYDPATNTWSSTLKEFSAMGKRFVEEKVAAGATDIAFVDLNEPSLAWYSRLCEKERTHASTDYYFRAKRGEGIDGTHPNDVGVDHFACMFFEEARNIVNADPESPKPTCWRSCWTGSGRRAPIKSPLPLPI